jgi:tetratricopeptide (TPR) repeat protein
MQSTTDDTAGALTPERLQQIRHLFETLITLAPVPRRLAIWDARKRDPILAIEAERLVAAYEHDTDFLDEPINLPPALAGTAGAIDDADLTGTRIGAYEVLREIGRGGMGTVYEGVRTDGSFRMRVAIKILRATLMTQSVRERFRREQQILAGLDHPGIARILDGGTTPAGRPYFVMEYIEGTRIDRYCQDRAPALDERLNLFRQVGEAVQYAHDRLIVHRDLKPANILVTAGGNVKLLDFGIAKLLSDPSTPQPGGAASALLLTPEYASPEQVLGRTITTATDVYLLGLLLYELLADVHPFRQAGQAPHETMRAICQSEPRKPSTVASSNKMRRQLRGELDNVVLMALQQEPVRRYSSVGRFCDDIERYSAGLPVRAHGDRLGYRAAKFLRRHTLAVAAILVVIASLGAGVIVSLAEARRVQQEQRKLRSLVTTLLFDLHDGIHSLAGSGPARRLVLSTAQTYLEALSRESGNDVPLQRELATAYEKTGDLLHEAIGTTADTSALDSYRKALQLRKALARQAGSTPETQRELAFSVSKVGDGHFFHGETKEALDDYANALNLAQPLVQTAPADAASRKVLGYIQNRRCIVLASAGDVRNATEACQASIANLEQALETLSSDNLVRRTLAATYATFGNLQAHLNHIPDGLNDLRRAEVMFDALAAEQPNDVDYRRRIAYTQLYMAQALVKQADQRDRAAGLAAYSKAVTSMETLVSIDPSDAKSPTNLAFMLTQMADQMKKEGNLADAEHAGAKAIELLRIVAERPGSGPLEWNEYANALVKSDFASQRQPAVALDLARRASIATKDANPRILDTLAWAYYRTGDRQAAIATEQKALSLVAASNALGQGLRQELEENLARFEKLFEAAGTRRGRA